jgi:hypothetical protein
MAPTTLKKIIFVLVFCFLPLGIIRASVIINEIAWMGDTASYNHEWIELFNNEANDISLAGWTLKTADEKIKISLSGLIPAGGFFLLEKSSDASVKDLLADLIYQGSLNNAGEKIQLFNAQKKLADEVDNSASWGAGDNKTKQTMARFNDQWCTSQAVGGTPKATNQCLAKNSETILPATSTPTNESATANLVATPTQTPKDIKNVFINEVLPSPEGPDTENEWIEIYNANNFSVDISGWQIKDTVGSIRKYNFVYGSIIPSQGFLILMSPQTKISLQNNGDGLILTNTKNDVVDQVTYPKALANQSYNRVGLTTNWQWSLALTPGKPNIIKNSIPTSLNPTEPTPPINANISQNQNASPSFNDNNKSTNKPSFNFNFLIGILVTLASTTIVLILSKKFSPNNTEG